MSNSTLLMQPSILLVVFLFAIAEKFEAITNKSIKRYLQFFFLRHS